MESFKRIRERVMVTQMGKNRASHDKREGKSCGEYSVYAYGSLSFLAECKFSLRHFIGPEGSAPALTVAAYNIQHELCGTFRLNLC
jgi:hypothetical protein